MFKRMDGFVCQSSFVHLVIVKDTPPNPLFALSIKSKLSRLEASNMVFATSYFPSQRLGSFRDMKIDR